jgi:hypothetical protein
MQSHIVGNVSASWPLGEQLYHHTPIFTAFDDADGRGQVAGSLNFGSGSDSFYEYLLKSQLILPHHSPELYVEFYRRLVRQLNHEYDLLLGGSVEAAQSPQQAGPAAPPPATTVPGLLALFRSEQRPGLKLLFVHEQRLFLSAAPGERYHAHLGCFVPGLMMLGATALADRALSRDIEIALRLLDGCLWTYDEPRLTQHGLGAELIDLQEHRYEENRAQQQQEQQQQEQQRQNPHYSGDFGYLLRPETVESVFVAWRTTRDVKWRAAAWRIFTALQRLQASGGGFHGVADVRRGFNATAGDNVVDEQPSFFIAETLKYLFLTFDDPERLSLKDWVFNTECHPFRLPKKNRSALPQRSCGL